MSDEPVTANRMSAAARRLRELAEAATPGPWVHGDRWVIAGVLGKGGKCTACHRLGEPEWTGVRDINGRRMTAHAHREPLPWPHGIFSEAEIGNPTIIVNDTADYGYVSPEDAAWISTLDPIVGAAFAELLGAVAADGDTSSLVHQAAAKVVRALERKADG